MIWGVNGGAASALGPRRQQLLTGIKRFLEIATFPAAVAVDSRTDMVYYFDIR
jgi:hypothetical protein